MSGFWFGLGFVSGVYFMAGVSIYTYNSMSKASGFKTAMKCVVWPLFYVRF